MTYIIATFISRHLFEINPRQKEYLTEEYVVISLMRHEK